MKYILIAPVEEDIDYLFLSVREFRISKIHLLSLPNELEKAQKIVAELKRFKIPVQISKIVGLTEFDTWENSFKVISGIKKSKKEAEILVYVGKENSFKMCCNICASYVNGLKAFTINQNNITMLPVMKFSYYKSISDKKMNLLKMLNNRNCCSSLEELSKKSGHSLSLISYHINGNLKSEGLKSMGLVETTEHKGKIAVELSQLGRMLVKGYL